MLIKVIGKNKQKSMNKFIFPSPCKKFNPIHLADRNCSPKSDSKNGSKSGCLYLTHYRAKKTTPEDGFIVN